VRELLPLNPLDGVTLSVEFHCEYYLLNTDIFAVVIERRFAYVSGSGWAIQLLLTFFVSCRDR